MQLPKNIKHELKFFLQNLPKFHHWLDLVFATLHLVTFSG